MTQAFKSPIRMLAVLAVIGLTTGFSAQGVRHADKKTIEIKNTTKFSIDEIYISPDEEDHWGNDILDDDEILTPGEMIEVEVDCGKWDVKLVAEDNSECQVEDVTLCKADRWNIVADCPK
ncbi:hypothetical protein [Fibrella forsythiae]|uniref:Uncharacterized protein n=1 Tax=Fibrella forsythiae TaxID=2817061 RepID=A0ABS3JEW0_9BACT|nr:hypothetical protein [Fibrella forsythiae]MBO0948549.1 hypothetical protein [Fibrella forsythiae]